MLGNVQGTLFHFFASTPLYFKGEVVALPPASCSRAQGLMCLQRPGRCAGVIVAAVKFSVASISRCCSKLIWYLDAKEKERQHFGFCWSKSLHWCCSRCSTAIAKWSFLLLWGDLRHHWRFGRDLSCAPCVFMGPPCEDRVALIPLWGFGRPKAHPLPHRCAGLLTSYPWLRNWSSPGELQHPCVTLSLPFLLFSTLFWGFFCGFGGFV